MKSEEIKYQFIKKIIDGELTLSEVKSQISDYEQQYGADFFADYDVNKKEQPWDEKYLKELELKSISGLQSKQFILHLAEVSEYVHSKNKKTKTKKKSLLI